MIDPVHSLLLIAVMAGVTAAIRFLPFLLFRKNTPKTVLYLGEVLPFAIMGMLVIYCLRNISFTGETHALPEFLAVALTAALHKWRHNTLLSILGGTVFYMILVQAVFA